MKKRENVKSAYVVPSIVVYQVKTTCCMITSSKEAKTNNDSGTESLEEEDFNW